jgi:acyl-CoA dehydrogenase
MDFGYTQQQDDFRKTVRKWVDQEAPKSWARELERDEGHYPFELWEKFTEAGFHGIGIDEAYGGSGGDVVDQMILARELARSLAGLTWVWGISSFAGGKSVGLYGSEEQKSRFLPEIVEGRARFSIGFTEPGGGTDVLGALRTTARKSDGGWVLSGQKTWCSASQASHYILLLARTRKDVAKQHEGVSLFLVPTSGEGVTIQPIPKLGMRALGSCDVFLDDVFVPDELLLGEQDRAWYMLLPTLNNERVMLAAFCLGIMDGVLEDALEHLRNRRAFGHSIGEFQALQHHVANIAMWRKQSELTVMEAASLLAQNQPAFQESTMAKVIASEAAVNSADLGIQILGGMGYSAETDMQRYWRDARLFRIGPITNEMARNSIAENLGLPRSF